VSREAGQAPEASQLSPSDGAAGLAGRPPSVAWRHNEDLGHQNQPADTVHLSVACTNAKLHGGLIYAAICENSRGSHG